jgi:hypothetical protein
MGAFGVGDARRENAHRGYQLGLSDHVGHRLHMDRMDCEEKCRGQRTFPPHESIDESEDQEGCQAVEEHVEHVKRKGALVAHWTAKRNTARGRYSPRSSASAPGQ